MMFSEGVLIALVSGASAVIAAIVSFLTSKHIAGKEIQKMKIAWNYEEKREYEQNFSELITATKIFCDKREWGSHRNAIEKINQCRTKATGEEAKLIDTLYAELSIAGTRPPDWSKVHDLLDSLVETHRLRK